jgi:two-component system, NtrC family, sensor kinase
VYVPLKSSGTSIGAIGVGRREPGPFASHHIELLQTFADQATIAIENVRLFNETKEALARQTATSDVLKVIASSPSNLQPVFDAIAERSKALIGAHSTVVVRYINGMIHLAAFTPVSPEADAAIRAMFDTPRPPVAGDPQTERVLRGEIARITDAEAELQGKVMLDAARARGWRSRLLVPLKDDADVIGWIGITRKEAGAFAEKDVELLRTFADQAVIAISNVELFQEVQQRTRELSESLQQQTATSEVLQVISASPGDLAPVFNKMLENATRVCGAEFGSMVLVEGNEFRNAAFFNAPPAFVRARRGQVTQLHPRSTLAEAIRTRQVMQIEDLRTSPAYLERTPSTVQLAELGGARTIVVVPMLRENDVIGLITVYRQEVRPFTGKQIELLTNFASQAVIAIENARLLRELRQRTDDLSEALVYQTGSSNILKVIASSPTDVGPALQAIVKSACEICAANDAVAMMKDANDLRISAHHGTLAVSFESRQISRQWVIGRAVVDRATLHVADLLGPEGDEFAESREISHKEGYRTVLGVPLLLEGEAIGVICLRRTEVQPFNHKQIELLKSFADQAVIAISNVRLFEQVQERTRDLTESLQFQTASADVLKVISRSPDSLQPVLDAIVETSRELCGSDASTIFLLRNGKFHFTAVSGSVPKHMEFLRTNPAPSDGPVTVFTRVHELKRTLHYPNVIEDPDLDQERSALGGPRALLVAPLIRDGEVLGVIVLRQPHTRPFTPRQIQAIETFADQAVIAISNVNLFEQVQERTRALSKSLNDLRTAQDRLVQTQKLASLGQLTAGIAHEIKNPLNFVNNFSGLSVELIDEMTDVFQNTKLDEASRRKELDEIRELLKSNLEKVVQHGKRADSIVKNMLLHSREGIGEHRPVEINAIIDESLNLAYHGARAEKPGFNITLERDFDPTVGVADIYPQEVTRAFLNLISNGFYAATQRAARGNGFEPKLKAATRNLGDKVEIRIRDNGMGIPPDIREKIFNPFFTTKPAGEGTGLGLSMSHDIVVKQHGGTIEVVTEPGSFTEFIVTLPRVMA